MNQCDNIKFSSKISKNQLPSILFNNLFRHQNRLTLANKTLKIDLARFAFFFY